MPSESSEPPSNTSSALVCFDFDDSLIDDESDNFEKVFYPMIQEEFVRLKTLESYKKYADTKNISFDEYQKAINDVADKEYFKQKEVYAQKVAGHPIDKQLNGENGIGAKINQNPNINVQYDKDYLNELLEKSEAKIIQNIRLEGQPFDGILELLEKLKNEGAAICIVTSSPIERVEALLDRMTGIEKYFKKGHNIFSAQTLMKENPSQVKAKKPAPDVYNFAKQEMQEINGAVFLSTVALEDSSGGVRSSVAAGIPVIGALYASRIINKEQHGDALQKDGACALARSPYELYDAIKYELNRQEAKVFANQNEVVNLSQLAVLDVRSR